MPQFITRVELHDANEEDYENLHKYMEQVHFSRTIKGSDGFLYKLPTAEYSCSGDVTASNVLDIAQGAARKTGKSYWVLVTEAQSTVWYLQKA